MGDPRRFRAFADFIAETWPDRSLQIADVAGGKGGLAAEMYRRGYRDVVTFDKRRNRANPARRHYRYALFGPGDAAGFDLIVGMHPDGGTDRAMDEAIREGLPYAVVPCCPHPNAWPFDDQGQTGVERSRLWFIHLIRTARDLGSAIEFRSLPITGANVILFDRGPTAAPS